jgi:DNA gyrase subunit B
VRLFLKMDEATERPMIEIVRELHGNRRVTRMDADFMQSGDYLQIRNTAQVLEGIVRTGAVVTRGEHRKSVSDFKEALDWLFEDVKRGLSIQRYKGLGEMNPDQLWETTMDPSTRRLLKARIDDSIAADEIFTTLMGDLVEPRRAFIETNALGVRNLDV